MRSKIQPIDFSNFVMKHPVVVPTSSVSFCSVTSNLVEGIQLAIAKEKMQPKMTSMTAISMLLSWKTQVRSYYIYVEQSISQ